MADDYLGNTIFTNYFRRYALCLALFAIILATASVLLYFDIKINLTILVIVGLVAATWYGGRGPGILLAVLIQATTIIFNPVPPDSNIWKVGFGHFSVFALLIFIVLLISGRRTVEQRLREKSTQLEEMNETLEQRVEERTIELKAANQELEAFSYAVSHDLRAPLRAIDGFSAALLEDYRGKLDDEGEKYLNFVRGGSRQMGQLIEDLLKLSRLTRADLSRQNIDLSNVAREILEGLRQREPGRKVDVEITDDIIVYGDERLLRVALQNLLDNAWKFTSKKPSARIAVGMQADGDKTEYFVRDNGAGFDMAYADKLFGAFQRMHSVDEFEGSGIGLATVKRVVRRHGGSIRAESVIGEGTGFYFTL